MLQEIITWVIVAMCVLYAVRAIVRRFRGRGKSCDCGCGNRSDTKDSGSPSTGVCSGCAVADLCKKPQKKQ